MCLCKRYYIRIFTCYFWSSPGQFVGSMFYIIFINDMFDSFKVARPFTFTDDTKLLFIIHNSSDYIRLQKDLDELSQWNSLWDLSLNPTKCHHIHYHFSSILHDIGVGMVGQLPYHHSTLPYHQKFQNPPFQ